MAKSPQAFRTISEIAGELDVPQHVLRFWEAKFTQIRPLRRGGGLWAAVGAGAATDAGRRDQYELGGLASAPAEAPAGAADQAGESAGVEGLDAGTRAALEAIRAELEAARVALDARLRR